MDGTYSHGDHNMYKNLYNSLLNTQEYRQGGYVFYP